MNFIKEHFIKIVLVLGFVSLGAFLFFKGIHIHITNNNHQEQYQYQSQLSINLFMATSEVQWKAIPICPTIECYLSERSKLPAEKSYFASREIEYGFFSNKYYLVYPEFYRK